MLPFIAGVAAGAVAVVAFNNNKKIRKTVNQSAKKAKEIAKEGYEKTKEFAGDIKETVSEKIDCLKAKKNISENEKIELNEQTENKENDK